MIPPTLVTATPSAQPASQEASAKMMRAPSVQLLLVGYLLALAFMLGIGWPWPQDPDIWWHLKTGEWIATHGAIMRTDSFGANTNNAHYMLPSWLAEILFYRANQLDPIMGLRILQGLVVTATMTVLLIHAWLTSRSFRLALLLSMLFLIPVFPWVARPQIFSFMFVALTMLLLWWGHNRSRRAWWFLVPLMLLWANLHVYFIVGLGLIVLTLGLPWVRWIFINRAQNARPPHASLVVLALSALAPLFNPYGYHLYTELLFITAHASGSWAAGSILELLSPDFHDWPMHVFFGWVTAVFLAFLLSSKRPAGLAIFLFLGLLYQSLQHRRDVPYFLIIMLPIMAGHIAHIPGAAWKRTLEVDVSYVLKEPGILRSSFHWILALGALVGLLAAPHRLAPIFPKPDEVPGFSGATRYMLKERPPGPIYNSLAKGGYLIYALWPTYQTSIDGRTGLYSDAYWQAHNDIRHGRTGWHENLLASKACTVVWERNEPLVSLLRLKSEWRLEYEDEKAVIFVRRQCL